MNIEYPHHNVEITTITWYIVQYYAFNIQKQTAKRNGWLVRMRMVEGRSSILISRAEIDSRVISWLFLVVNIRGHSDYAYFGNMHILRFLDYAYFGNMHIWEWRDHIAEICIFGNGLTMHIAKICIFRAYQYDYSRFELYNVILLCTWYLYSSMKYWFRNQSLYIYVCYVNTWQYDTSYRGYGIRGVLRVCLIPQYCFPLFLTLPRPCLLAINDWQCLEWSCCLWS